jgi:hypothetical protein
LPAIVSTGIIFTFMHMCKQYLHHIHSFTHFTSPLHSPTDTNTLAFGRTFAALLFS